MEQVGWWIVGGETAKFGRYRLGDQFVPMTDTGDYWQNRGYTRVPVYSNENDLEDWGVKE